MREASGIGSEVLVEIQDVVARIEQGRRIPDVSSRDKTLAWIRFFSQAERIDRGEAARETPGAQTGAA
jgi:hypothetical protein